MSKKWRLDISDHDKTIQGCFIYDERVYHDVKYRVIAECRDGWRPEHKDIKALVETYYSSNPLLYQLMPEFLNELKQKLGK